MSNTSNTNNTRYTIDGRQYNICPICASEVDSRIYYQHLQSHSHYDRLNPFITLFNPLNLTINPYFNTIDDTVDASDINDSESDDITPTRTRHVTQFNEVLSAFSTMSETLINMTNSGPMSSPFATLQTSPVNQSPFFHHQLSWLNIGIDDDMLNDYEGNLRLAEALGKVDVGIDDIGQVSCIVEKDKVAEDGKCAICLDTLTECDGDLRMLICSHTFCHTCINTWLSKHKKCPVCNIDLLDMFNSLSSTNDLDEVE
jgi:hypothetical protein